MNKEEIFNLHQELTSCIVNLKNYTWVLERNFNEERKQIAIEGLKKVEEKLRNLDTPLKSLFIKERG